MSEQSKAMVRRFFDDVLTRGDFDAIPEIFTLDYVDHDPASPREVRGHDGIRRDVEPYVGALSDIQVTIDDQIAAGDRVATRITVRGTQVEQLLDIAPTGVRIAMTGMVFHRVAHGRLAEGWWNWDTLGLLQQLGAIPAELKG